MVQLYVFDGHESYEWPKEENPGWRSSSFDKEQQELNNLKMAVQHLGWPDYFLTRRCFNPDEEDARKRGLYWVGAKLKNCLENGTDRDLEDNRVTEDSCGIILRANEWIWATAHKTQQPSDFYIWYPDDQLGCLPTGMVPDLFLVMDATFYNPFQFKIGKEVITRNDKFYQQDLAKRKRGLLGLVLFDIRERAPCLIKKRLRFELTEANFPDVMREIEEEGYFSSPLTL